jgi:integrase
LAGTKDDGVSHRVWLPRPVLDIIAEIGPEPGGFVFTNANGNPVTKLDRAMRDICAMLRVKAKVTPHDLRRSHGTMVCRLGFGREAMNRIQNHRDGGIASVYDQYQYRDEDAQVMESVAAVYGTGGFPIRICFAAVAKPI